MKLVIGKRHQNIVEESNALVNAIDKGNLITNIADATGCNVEIDADVEGVVGKIVDSQNLVIDGKLKAQILQEEKRKNIVAQSEEKRKSAEQEHQHEMEKMRFEKEKEAAKKNGYQVWQEEKRKNIALAEEERRKAAEMENQLILEKEKMEVEKERLAIERERLVTEREHIALELEKTSVEKEREKQKTMRVLIITTGCLIAFFIAILLL